MRGLVLFWVALLLLAGSGAAVLNRMGPLPRTARNAGQAAPSDTAQPPMANRPGRNERIALPNSSLQEEGPDGPLPRIAADGWKPMLAYARAFDRNDPRPRIGLVLAGIGLDANASRDAIEALPGGVTLAISPYGRALGPTLDLARAKGDELLASLPLESGDRPAAELGDVGLLAAAPPGSNERNLLRVLSRFSGYVGATGASDGLRGERFAANAPGMAQLASALAGRGLLYIDPRPRAEPPAGVPARAVDLVLDDPPGRAEVEAKLAQLERLARERGSALGLAGPLRPVVIERIAAWAQGLESRGIVLAPASALVATPTPPTGVP